MNEIKTQIETALHRLECLRGTKEISALVSELQELRLAFIQIDEYAEENGAPDETLDIIEEVFDAIDLMLQLPDKALMKCYQEETADIIQLLNSILS